MIKALTSLEALKIALGISDETETFDDLLTQLIEGVSQAVRRRTNREFNEATYTEYYSGEGREIICLRHRPVTAISGDEEEALGVWLDANGFYGQAPSAFPASTKLTHGVDYFVRTLERNENNPAELVLITNPWAFGILNQTAPIGEAVHALWPMGRGNIKVVYTAGYRDIPADLEQAVHTLCKIARASGPKGNLVKSETLGRYAYELLTGADLKGTDPDLVSARSIIAAYTEVCI